MTVFTRNLPVSSSIATLQPVRMPGSMASTRFSPSGAASSRWREQQVAQVLREHLHRRAVCGKFLLHHHVDLAARREQALVGVLGGKADVRVFLAAARAVHDVEDVLDERLLVHDEAHPEDTLLLSAPDGEEAVAGNVGDRLLEVVVLLELCRSNFVGSVGLGVTTSLFTLAFVANAWRTRPRTSAMSAMRSAMMSRAPWRSSGVADSASPRRSSQIASASGSSPFSLAIIARVRRFGL